VNKTTLPKLVLTRSLPIYLSRNIVTILVYQIYRIISLNKMDTYYYEYTTQIKEGSYTYSYTRWVKVNV